MNQFLGLFFSLAFVSLQVCNRLEAGFWYEFETGLPCFDVCGLKQVYSVLAFCSEVLCRLYGFEQVGGVMQALKLSWFIVQAGLWYMQVCGGLSWFRLAL